VKASRNLFVIMSLVLIAAGYVRDRVSSMAHRE
jgi:hypothetical protein